MKKSTEETSLYNNLEKMSIDDLLININHEDQKVAKVISKEIPYITELANTIVKKMASGGRLFYIGSGTSGRLGIVDASECPPTFGVSKNMVVGIIAGGDSAIRASVESAEDNMSQAWKDLKSHNITKKDVVVGISASGTTPYVIGGLKDCQKHNIYTGCITCNKNMPILKVSDSPIVLLVGPEFVTGSTRMKAGTAQKMTLNMLSTSVMIKLGHVIDNKMVDMHINNKKLEKRAIQIIQNVSTLKETEALELLKKYGSVRKVLNNI
jgi:N-acetylmuramic acid 6-phosphate etherase